MRGFGTKDPGFFYGLLAQIVNAGSKGNDPDETGIRFMIGFIKSREPRDEFEATMLAQMAATHLAIMRFTNRLAHAEPLHERDSAERALNKLMRTYTMQLEAFQRYRFFHDRRSFIQHRSVSHAVQEIKVSSESEKGESKKDADLSLLLTNARQTRRRIIDRPQRTPVALKRSQQK
jgi:hypothetical protein